MKRRITLVNLLSILALLLLACQPAAPAPTRPSESKPAAPAAPAAAPAAPAAPAKQAAPAAKTEPKPGGPTRVSVAVSHQLDSFPDPYDHSDTFLYPVWCEVLGCLTTWDAEKGEPVPQLAESWEVENPTTWIFHLRKEAKWADGTPFTSADVVHTLEQVANHPKAKQIDRVRHIEKVEAVDPHTVKVITKEPAAELLDATFTVGISMTQKAQHDRGDDLTKAIPIGTGPYALKEFQNGQRAVLTKVPNWWGGPVEGPDEVVYRSIREPEVRLTALLNGEVQIANVLPHMAERVKSTPNLQLMEGGSLTIMFLGMSPAYPPWDNKLVRQAVAYAIDRDSLIENVLDGYADRLDGPIGPGQYAYDPNLQPRYTFDPEKSKQLLAQAGFPNGLDVELTSTTGTYVKDREVAQAVTEMLNDVGIRTTHLTPESATVFVDIQAGQVPFYYFGRGQVRDPGRPLAQYFETGASKRLQYSNPKLDEIFVKARASFEDAERKKLLSEAMSIIAEEVPAHFMWRYRFLWGVTNNVEWTPRGDEAHYANEIRVKQ